MLAYGQPGAPLVNVAAKMRVIAHRQFRLTVGSPCA